MDILQQHISGLLSHDIQTRNLAESSFNEYWMSNSTHAKELLPLLCMGLHANYSITVSRPLQYTVFILTLAVQLEPIASSCFVP